MNTTSKQGTVVGVFRDEDRAREAVRALGQAGFTESQISVVARHNPDGKTSDAASGAATGAATGIGVGAGVAALWSLGISFGVIPVIGPILAAGPIAAALLSAAGGAAAGGIVGALVGMGLSDDDASYYENEFKSGGTLVTVKADRRCDEAWSILQRHGAYSRDTAATAETCGTATAASKGTARTSKTGDTLRLHEEELHARKEQVSAGEVRARKEVVTEQKTLNVPVTREEVVIERHPASGKASSSGIGAEEVRIPVMEEQVRVEKTPVVKEEVTLKKQSVQGTEKVSGTVRKEELRVDEKGDPNVRTNDPSRTAKKR